MTRRTFVDAACGEVTSALVQWVLLGVKVIAELRRIVLDRVVRIIFSLRSRQSQAFGHIVKDVNAVVDSAEKL